MIGRRGFITGLVSLVAAPAIVRAGSLMPVKVTVEPLEVYGVSPAMQALPAAGDSFTIERLLRAKAFLRAATLHPRSDMVDLHFMAMSSPIESLQ